jgi:hypothetical protein
VAYSWGNLVFVDCQYHERRIPRRTDGSSLEPGAADVLGSAADDFGVLTSL